MGLLILFYEAQHIGVLNVKEAASRRDIELAISHYIQSVHISHRLIGDALTDQQRRANLLVGHVIEHPAPHRSRQMKRWRRRFVFGSRFLTPAASHNAIACTSLALGGGGIALGRHGEVQVKGRGGLWMVCAEFQNTKYKFPYSKFESFSYL